MSVPNRKERLFFQGCQIFSVYQEKLSLLVKKLLVGEEQFSYFISQNPTIAFVLPQFTITMPAEVKVCYNYQQKQRLFVSDNYCYHSFQLSVFSVNKSIIISTLLCNIKQATKDILLLVFAHIFLIFQAQVQLFSSSSFEQAKNLSTKTSRKFETLQ
eukprot:TRINITY_DN2544_c0_g2_i3.p3 TRINITY_DN2544_c0_g2~~TRINITY_DN2544_c0_g2_i3.p3  ORF type:complete len:157 (-),score=3.43 TRINITY_DN2544_c0_g2_i3:1375-1845(-)